MTRPELYALVYGSLRGLYELPMTIALAWYYHNWIIALWGLLGAGMGICYMIAGKVSKDHATRWAEILYGLWRGGILYLCLIFVTR